MSRKNNNRLDLCRKALDAAASGIGEVGLPPIGPAIANAVARLTGGMRLRHYPFLPERIKEALKTGTSAARTV